MTPKEENIVNIAMAAAGMMQKGKIKVEDHMDLTQVIVSLAEKFEKENAHVDYNAGIDELRNAGEPARDYWEDIDAFAETELLERYGERQISIEGKTYEIYQLKHDEVGHNMLFLSLNQMAKYGHTVNTEHYNMVYSGPVAPEAPVKKILNDLFTQFNIDHPKDFRGHSMSVSDIVVLNDNGNKTAYFCDRSTFEEIPGFFEPQRADTLEQLAADLDEFTFNADPYEYKDNYDSREEGRACVTDVLSKGATGDIKGWIYEMLEEGRVPGDEGQARELLSRVARFEKSFSQEKKVSLNEKIADAKEKSSKSLPDKENVRTSDSKQR